MKNFHKFSLLDPMQCGSCMLSERGDWPRRMPVHQGLRLRAGPAPQGLHQLQRDLLDGLRGLPEEVLLRGRSQRQVSRSGEVQAHARRVLW